MRSVGVGDLTGNFGLGFGLGCAAAALGFCILRSFATGGGACLSDLELLAASGGVGDGGGFGAAGGLHALGGGDASGLFCFGECLFPCEFGVFWPGWTWRLPPPVGRLSRRRLPQFRRWPGLGAPARGPVRRHDAEAARDIHAGRRRSRGTLHRAGLPRSRGRLRLRASLLWAALRFALCCAFPWWPVLLVTGNELWGGLRTCGGVAERAARETAVKRYAEATLGIRASQ